MDKNIELITGSDNRFDVVENIKHNGVRPIKVLTDLLNDDGKLHGEDLWELCTMVQEKVYELYERLEFVMKEQRELAQTDAKSQCN